MKKYLIGSIVGGIILFLWQGASWMGIGIHSNDMKYTSAQDQIMPVITANLKEDGAYYMPSAATMKEKEELMKSMEGKPGVTIIYDSAFNSDMTMRFIRCVLVDIFLAISLIYVLTRGGTPTALRVFSGSVAFGLATWLWTQYMGHIWFDLPWHMITGQLIDSIVAFALCGIWLGWWLNRPTVPKGPATV